MKAQKTVPILVLISLLLISGVCAYSVTSNGVTTEVNAPSDNLFTDIVNWFKNLFGTSVEDFTIVGQDRHCDTYVKEGNTQYFNYNVLMNVNTIDYCSQSYGLIDVYDKKWNKKGEYKNSINFNCDDSDGCIVEIYCCPHPECTSNSNCESWIGTGSKCITKNEVDSLLPLKDNNQNIISSYKYCTPKCSGTSINCWRLESGVCNKRTYDCSYSTYPNCPTTYPFTTEASCKNTIPVNPPVTPPVEPPIAGCGDSVCTTGERMGAPFGTICNQDCENVALKDNLEIYNVNYLDINGNKLPDKLVPGQQIKVTFSVRSTDYFKGTPYMVEVGVIPFSTAETWGIAQPTGSYSIFDLFSVKESDKDACCIGQSNFADNSEELKAVTNFWTGEVIPNTKDFVFTVMVPDSTTTDLCGSEKYWDNNNSKEVIYVIVKNGCFKDGYRRNTFISSVIPLDTNATTSQQGKTCEFDGQCGVGEKCLDAPGFFTGKTCQGGTTSGNLSLIDTKKISLTTEQISSATTETLLSSACLYDSECLINNNNYTSSCVSIDKLRQDGTLSEATKKSFFDKAKTITSGTVIGATAGVIGCTIVWGGVGLVVGGPAGAALSVANVLANPATLGGCAAVGGLLGGTGTGVAVSISQDDALVKKLGASDSSSVGICTLSETDGFSDLFKSLALFDIDGNGKKDSTDGMIILFGGVALLFLAMSMGGRK
ncbi:MAG: hypothetical protein WC758_07765 [Candidatus Woesearchaeota archaeon]|jgi:hypothetical protein